MAKGRMVHKKIWDSNQFNSLKIPLRLLYIGLITIADDYGCFRTEGDFLKKKLLYKDRISATQIEAMLQKINEVGLIEYRKTEFGSMGVHPKWTTYQKLRNDIARFSDFPDFDVETMDLPWLRDVNIREDKRSKENINSREEKIIESNERERSPVLSGREQTMKAWSSAKKKPNPFSDLL